MRPEFKLSKLSALPLSDRRVAKLAADASTPVNIVSKAIHQLYGAYRRNPDPGQYAWKLLPVVYAILDPARLPDDTTPELALLHRLVIATSAMTLLFLKNLNVAVVCDVWPCIWAWIHFIDTLDYFPDVSVCGYTRLSLMKQLGNFLFWGHSELVFDTPGVCVFIAHAWANMVARGEVDYAGLLVISDTLATYDHLPQCLEELVEGAGGMDDLARLILTYVDLLVCDLGINESEASRFKLRYSLRNVLVLVSRPTPGVLALQKSLMRAGIVAALSDALIKLASAGALEKVPHVSSYGHSSTPPCSCHSCVMDLCMQNLTSLLSAMRSPKLEKTLDTDILRTIITGTVSNYRAPNVSEALKHFMGTTLVGATRCYTFMRSLGTVLPEALAIQPSRAFMDSPLWHDWILFTSLAQERLQSFHEFRSSLMSRRSCGNFECNILITQKTDLRRCSACQAQYYCSAECQIISWRAQDHRRICAFTQGSELDDRVEGNNNRFYRFTILRDYQTQKTAILLQKLAHIHRTGNTNFCVIMSFISACCIPRVAPIEEWEHILESHPCIERSATGFREMHVVLEEPPRIRLALEMQFLGPDRWSRCVGPADSEGNGCCATGDIVPSAVRGVSKIGEH
ncbi:MYND-type domain-containing protein [Mycena sanguinolenta]|uniref:MYND-type domain-containing protein n=1 Tax=Mycena sanguinolenta TaxID=230812 RepID=A0A8H7CM31_9AGAR|nr:MYND-type domain-containing protein [Mycena sanguinolenta]